MVSELSGYLGRRHMRRSRYVTAEFSYTITTIDQNFTWAMLWPGQEPPLQATPPPMLLSMKVIAYLGARVSHMAADSQSARTV